ncbi:MAG: cob(I)yrinic acid a,c-diamide adenosyltransferase [Anaerolineae bacterium]|nr:cob(I)yrinic acid a,c-diamide adenosyltransferase [Anaerolineae bacterium]MDQ7036479.1 cob(I)yrinic acid a,c-diamide adenosyltransferase [Anaerolineae bacterium]
MKIYTKTGDDGTTSLFSGGRVGKNHLRVESYGTVDELNSHIGVIRAHKPSIPTEKELINIQEHLFRLGADLATPMDAKAEWLIRITAKEVEWLEYRIDQFSAHLAPLKNFILPGGSVVGANLHVARTVCRRAERLVVALADNEAVNEQALIYLNRLSDWLFTAARYENKQADIPEDKWVVRGES